MQDRVVFRGISVGLTPPLTLEMSIRYEIKTFSVGPKCFEIRHATPFGEW